MWDPLFRVLQQQLAIGGLGGAAAAMLIEGLRLLRTEAGRIDARIEEIERSIKASPSLTLAADPPPNVSAAGRAGASTSAAREDHTHGHGDQAGGTLHATASGAANGFLSSAGFTKLASIADGATKTPLGTNPPPDVATAGSAGTSSNAAREDHTHGHGDQAGGTLHALASGAANGFMSSAGFTKLAGIADGATKTPLGTNPPPAIAAAGSVGVSTSAAKEDHTHAHGDQAGGTLHALASGAANGFMSSAGFTKLAGIADGATKTPLGTNPPPDVAAAGSAGVSTSAAKEDHTHGHGNQAGGTLHALASGVANGFMSSAGFNKLAGIANGATNTPLSTNPPPSVAAASSTGVSTSVAREDHTHGHGNQAGGSLHDLASPGQNGFMTAAQVIKLQGIQDGATKAGQDITLWADKAADLLLNSAIGISGAVELFASQAVSEVCVIGGQLAEFRLEANTVAPSAIDITIFKASSGTVTYGATGITISVAMGARAGTASGSETVAAGDRLVGFSSGAWAHGGLTVRGRIMP